MGPNFEGVICDAVPGVYQSLRGVVGGLSNTVHGRVVGQTRALDRRRGYAHMRFHRGVEKRLFQLSAVLTLLGRLQTTLDFQSVVRNRHIGSSMRICA